MNDHVLVLGAGGFIGQHLVRALADDGRKVFAVSRRHIDFSNKNVEQIVEELDQPSQYLSLLRKCSAVVHLASGSTPGSSAGNAMAELQNNLQPTFALLQALQGHPNIPLLYLSSGGSLYADTQDELATEATPVDPRSYHGAGKLAAEHFISARCKQFGGAATILRPSNIYGPGQVERTGFGIIPATFGKITRGEYLTVWGDGSTVRDYLYIDDFIALCMRVLSTPMPPGTHIVNASSATGTSLNDLFSAVENVSGQALKRHYEASRQVDALQVVVDNALAKKYYDWAPVTPLQEGLRRTWEWFSTTQH